MTKHLVAGVSAIAILDSRGNPTVEAMVQLGDGTVERAAVPSGASKGRREAVELRDNDPTHFGGLGVNRAVENVKGPIARALLSAGLLDQGSLDRLLCELDGTRNKSRLGANAILAVSLAFAKAAANAARLELYEYFGQLTGLEPKMMPVPMLNFINGGVHARNDLAFQEIMLVPAGAESMDRALEMCSVVFAQLKHDLGPEIGVGDEGGFAPRQALAATTAEAVVRRALDSLLGAAEKVGLRDQMGLALDPAASEFYENGLYNLGFEKKTSAEMVDFYKSLLDSGYPLLSIEDGMAEDDLEGWALLTRELGQRVQLVGDDLFVTNAAILSEGIKARRANAILIKVNQVGTLSETLETIALAKRHGYASVISHRSGETTDYTIADLSVGCAAGQIKAGCLSRTERCAKYNQLLRIEASRPTVYAGWDAFPRSSRSRQTFAA
jgi:enolase